MKDFELWHLAAVCVYGGFRVMWKREYRVSDSRASVIEGWTDEDWPAPDDTIHATKAGAQAVIDAKPDWTPPQC